MKNAEYEIFHRARGLSCLLLSLLWTILAACVGQAQGSGREDVIPVTFRRSEQVFPPGQTVQIVLGDVDGDGYLDAVFANMGFSSSSVWLNDGKGEFVDSGQALAQQGHGVALDDLDGDGDLDIFMACAAYNEQPKPSRVYFNDGHGHFQDSVQDFGDSELSGNGVNLTDIDSDGDLDAQVYYYDTTLLTTFHILYLNDGDGIFHGCDVLFPNGTELTWGDLDRDGDADAFVKQWNLGYGVMLNDGQGTFTECWSAPDTAVMSGGAALGDIDGDEDLDALVANGNWTSHDSTIIFLNDGTGRFEDSGQRLHPTQWASLLLGDLNGDSLLDVFVNNNSLPNEVWLNEGGGILNDSGLRLGDNEPNSKGSLGDLDGDGDLDAFVTYFGVSPGSNSVWFNDTPPSNLSGPYAGQTAPALTPAVFAPGFISIVDGFYKERDISFWPGGLRCIFARFTASIADYVVFESKEVNGAWTAPEPVDWFGSGGAFEPGLTLDGNKIFFTPPGSQQHGEQYISCIEYSDSGWSDPALLFKGLYPSLTNDGTIYYTAFVNWKDHLACRRLAGGAYGPQQVVPAPVFSAYEDAHPCIAPDESYLIFDSEDRPRTNGCPLFISFCTTDGEWTEPVNLGSLIPMQGSLVRVTPDGEFLFFQCEGDIYWVDTGIIETLRPHEACCECADCNGNGSVNVLDALQEVNCILEITEPPCSCDCNRDGIDNVLDVLCVVNVILDGSCP